MVASRSNRAGTVVAGGETSIKRSSQKTVTIASIVDTLKESEGLSVRRVVGIIAHVLDRDMGMTNDFTALKCLWSSVVGVVRVRERSSL
jgi:hypothetical protein